MYVDITKYNLIRSSLVNNPNEEHDLVEVKPMKFALKKQHDEEVLAAAMEILDDQRIITGITPYQTIMSLIPDGEQPSPELILYVLVCYAVAIQQEWIIYSPILNKYRVNPDHKEAKQYVEDIHHVKVE